MNRMRILLADTYDLIIEGFRTLLEPRYEIVGAVREAKDLLGAVRSLRPDLIVLDTALPGLSTIENVRKTLPGVKLLFVTTPGAVLSMSAAAGEAGTGYVLKSSHLEELLRAVEHVSHGDAYVTPTLAQPPRPDRIVSLAAIAVKLSTREREVLQMVAEGNSEKEMAAQLAISIKTIAFHKARLKHKLGMRSTADIIKYAFKQGIV